MPTFEDPKPDAEELREAARALAYATRTITTPADVYDVLGSLQHTLIGVHQSLQQLAVWHRQHAPYAATDDGDRTAGRAHSAAASARLASAAQDVDRATDHVMAAFAENGRIAWQSEPHLQVGSEQYTALAEALARREAGLDPDLEPPTVPGATGQGLSR